MKLIVYIATDAAVSTPERQIKCLWNEYSLELYPGTLDERRVLGMFAYRKLPHPSIKALLPHEHMVTGIDILTAFSGSVQSHDVFSEHYGLMILTNDHPMAHQLSIERIYDMVHTHSDISLSDITVVRINSGLPDVTMTLHEYEHHLHENPSFSV